MDGYWMYSYRHSKNGNEYCGWAYSTEEQCVKEAVKERMDGNKVLQIRYYPAYTGNRGHKYLYYCIVHNYGEN